MIRNERQPRGLSVSLTIAILTLPAILATSAKPIVAATPDPVLEWIGFMNDAVIAANTNPLVTSRVVALVSGSVFDAVNGIEPRFQPLHVNPDAPHPSSQRAAAIQAAYAILAKLYPGQSATLTAHRNASLAALAPHETAASISNGTVWGQSVADAIWAWRLTDGIAPAPPPFLGVLGTVGSPAGNRRLAAYAANKCPGRGATVCFHDSMGARTTIAIPAAASAYARQSRVPRRSQ